MKNDRNKSRREIAEKYEQIDDNNNAEHVES